MENKTKFCKFCGETIDFDCVVCTKCGKQVEELKGQDGPIYINNSASSSASAAASSNNAYRRRLPWHLKTSSIILLGFLSGGIYWMVGPILRINWNSNN